MERAQTDEHGEYTALFLSHIPRELHEWLWAERQRRREGGEQVTICDIVAEAIRAYRAQLERA